MTKMQDYMKQNNMRPTDLRILLGISFESRAYVSRLIRGIDYISAKKQDEIAGKLGVNKEVIFEEIKDYSPPVKRYESICNYCEAKIVSSYRGKKYCNTSCYHKYIRLGKVLIESECTLCGKKRISTRRKRYCSTKCRKKHEEIENKLKEMYRHDKHIIF